MLNLFDMVIVLCLCRRLSLYFGDITTEQPTIQTMITSQSACPLNSPDNLHRDRAQRRYADPELGSEAWSALKMYLANHIYIYFHF